MQEMEHCQAVVLAVVDESGIRVIMDQLQEATKSENPNTRKAAINLLSSFCMNSKGDYSQYVPQLLRIFIHLLIDKDNEVLQLSWEALNAVTKVSRASCGDRIAVFFLFFFFAANAELRVVLTLGGLFVK